MRHWIVATAAVAALWPASASAAEVTAEQMARRVAESLRESGQLQNYRVGVKFEDGVATLLGNVTSPAQAEAAARIAGGIEGIDRVVNKLDIEGQAAPQEGVLLTTLKQAQNQAPRAQAKAPAPLPSLPEAQPARRVAAAPRGLPRPIQRTGAAMAAPQQVRPAQYGGAQYAGGAPQGYSTAGAQGVSYEGANMPGYAWPSYASYPNYAAVTYPQQYSPAAWPYIGPFYPYPQVPLGWRKVTLEWDDGWWHLDFSHHESH